MNPELRELLVLMRWLHRHRRHAWAQEGMDELMGELAAYMERDETAVANPLPSIPPRAISRKRRTAPTRPDDTLHAQKVDTDALPGAPAPENEVAAEILRHLEKAGPQTAKGISERIYGGPAQAGVVGGKIMPALQRRGLVAESDGFWRLTEKGTEKVLDAS